ncbi:hypothetical protein DL765_010149 [Monosporascus sp. GIB2]|nr:hypothetical protein DL765_010149 [Monosporascus sp. GIB2]
MAPKKTENGTETEAVSLSARDVKMMNLALKSLPSSVRSGINYDIIGEAADGPSTPTPSTPSPKKTPAKRSAVKKARPAVDDGEADLDESPTKKLKRNPKQPASIHKEAANSNVGVA